MGIRIFITDDHYMIIEGIRSLLQDEKNIEWLGHAMTADSCLAFLKKQQPDVLLLDVNLPDKSGIDLCKEIKTRYPKIQIIALSSFNQQSFIQKMLDNRASGYVLKNASKEEIINAIETVIEGDIFLSQEAALVMDQCDIPKTPIITRREKEVLLLIASGLTNLEIAEKLFISSATVDTHRKNLLAKFEAKNSASLVRLAYELNIV
ncbi:response regulator transcription factor [Flavobacteriaceae bacterium KMM 6897]|nr:response regulator transcription factor [Flavobacteriaceae bacterium KMM 6897]MEB8344516.1 response regulator transcription factor [Flavobacteriaceae bacterium KMM 6898]